METVERIVLATLPEEIFVCAERQSLQITTESDWLDLRTISGWPDSALASGRALNAALQCERLFEEGFATGTATDLRIRNEQLNAVMEAGYTLPVLWSEWSPFRAVLSAVRRDSGVVFDSGVMYGGRRVEATLCGRYVQQAVDGSACLLDEETATALGEPGESVWKLRAMAAELGAIGEGLIGHLPIRVPGFSPVASETEPAEAEPSEAEEVETEPVLTASEFARLSLRDLQAAVACLLMKDDNRSALLPESSPFGVSVIGLGERDVQLVHVLHEAGPALDGLLERVLAAESSYRAFFPGLTMRSAVFSRLPLPVAWWARLQQLRILFRGGSALHDELELAAIDASTLDRQRKDRCATLGEGLRALMRPGSHLHAA